MRIVKGAMFGPRRGHSAEGLRMFRAWLNAAAGAEFTNDYGHVMAVGFEVICAYWPLLGPAFGEAPRQISPHLRPTTNPAIRHSDRRVRLLQMQSVARRILRDHQSAASIRHDGRGNRPFRR